MVPALVIESIELIQAINKKHHQINEFIPTTNDSCDKNSFIHKKTLIIR